MNTYNSLVDYFKDAQSDTTIFFHPSVDLHKFQSMWEVSSHDLDGGMRVPLSVSSQARSLSYGFDAPLGSSCPDRVPSFECSQEVPLNETHKARGSPIHAFTYFDRVPSSSSLARENIREGGGLPGGTNSSLSRVLARAYNISTIE